MVARREDDRGHLVHGRQSAVAARPHRWPRLGLARDPGRRTVPGLVLTRWRLARVHASSRGKERPARDPDERSSQGRRTDQRRQELERSLLPGWKTDRVPPGEGWSHRSLLDGSGQCAHGRFCKDGDKAHARRRHRRREPARLGRLTGYGERVGFASSRACSWLRPFTRVPQRAARESNEPWFDVLVSFEYSVAMSTASR